MKTKRQIEKRIKELKKLNSSNPSKFLKLYREATSKALKDGNSYVLDTIPEEFRWFTIKKRKNRRRKKRSIYKIHAIDKRIYKNKFYPYSYRGLVPTLVLTGWYRRKNAKLLYDARYGKSWRKTVKFIKGEKAIKLGFQIGYTIFVDGRWLLPITKLTVSKDEKTTNTRKSYWWGIIKDLVEKGYTKKKIEDIITIRVLSRYEIKEKIPFRDFTIPGVKERFRLSKIQKITEERKKDLYEE